MHTRELRQREPISDLTGEILTRCRGFRETTRWVTSLIASDAAGTA